MLAKFINELKDRCEGTDVLEYSPIMFKANALELNVAGMTLRDKPGLKVCDNIKGQLQELVKLRNPQVVFTQGELAEAVSEWLASRELIEIGNWVYYPWRHTLVHLLDEDDFIEVRTVRNKLKITREEQELLKQKVAGIIGLSVGQSVAISLAMERIVGTIRIADFDHLELSNMNRIRTSVVNLGVPKCVIVAREIAEIDPFINVELFQQGINAENVDDFICGGNGLDVLLEECDSLEVKILSRMVARKNCVPVIMDTSDSFLLDVERYDLQNDRPILHGLINENFDELSDIEKRQMILSLIEVDKVSDRARKSLLEIGKSITNWPQLATDVIAGGAHAAMIAREILLGRPVVSGRTRLDFIDFHNQNSRFKT